MNRNLRNNGIDMLRICSMLAVVVIHVIGHGGVWELAQTDWEFSIFFWLMTVVQPAVDCFVLISGFVSYREDAYMMRPKNVISLYFVVFFYSVLMTGACKFLFPESVSVGDMIAACIPVISKQYWFFTAYVGMMLFSPLLNILVHAINKRQAFLLAMVVAIYSCFSLIKDPFSFHSGFSTIWFVCLYLLGAIIKKYDVSAMFSAKRWILMIAGAACAIGLSQEIFSKIEISIVQENSDFLLSNSSPMVLLMAASWLCIFSKMQFKQKLYPVIRACASSAFAVYLIHDNNHVRTYLISKISTFVCGYSIVELLMFVVGCALTIFVCSVLLDKIRMLLFRILNVDGYAERLGNAIEKSIANLYKRLNA